MFALKNLSPVVAVSTLIFLGFDVRSARAGLDGYVVSGGFAVNQTGGPFDPGTTLNDVGQTTVPGTIVEVQNYVYANFYDTSFVQSVNTGFNSFPFNGFIYQTAANAPSITGVTLTADNTSEPFTQQDISFNAHEIALNFSGQSTVGSVTISFTTASSVPEPSTLILLAFALPIIGFIAVRRGFRVIGITRARKPL